MKNRNANDKKNSHPEYGAGPRRGRGRPAKQLNLYNAFELALFGASLRQQARAAGCDPRTLMGKHLQDIERGELLFSGFLKQRLFRLAVVEKKWPAMRFLMEQILLEEKYQEMSDGQDQPEMRWSRARLRRAVRIMWRYSQPKAKRGRRTERGNAKLLDRSKRSN